MRRFTPSNHIPNEIQTKVIFEVSVEEGTKEEEKIKNEEAENWGGERENGMTTAVWITWSSVPHYAVHSATCPRYGFLTIIPGKANYWSLLCGWSVSVGIPIGCMRMPDFYSKAMMLLESSRVSRFELDFVKVYVDPVTARFEYLQKWVPGTDIPAMKMLTMRGILTLFIELVATSLV